MTVISTVFVLVGVCNSKNNRIKTCLVVVVDVEVVVLVVLVVVLVVVVVGLNVVVLKGNQLLRN